MFGVGGKVLSLADVRIANVDLASIGATVVGGGGRLGERLELELAVGVGRVDESGARVQALVDERRLAVVLRPADLVLHILVDVGETHELKLAALVGRCRHVRSAPLLDGDLQRHFSIELARIVQQLKTKEENVRFLCCAVCVYA